MPRGTLTLEQRFWAKVAKGDVCWNWTGAKSAAGYGNFTACGRTCAAHRFAYGLLIGSIPDGLQIDHLCRNRLCVNPDHLEPVTQAENLRRGNLGARKIFCAHGHEFTPENTYRQPKSGTRQCRACKERRTREFRERRSRGIPGHSRL